MFIVKNKKFIEQEILTRQPLIVEIVGPAGVGKTSLLNAIVQRDKKVLTDLPIPKIQYLRLLIHHTLMLFPTYLCQYRNTRWFSAGESRSMVYLEGWSKILEKHSLNNCPAVVLDHGPIFRLTLLREFGPDITTSHPYLQWWNSLLETWKNTLDIVISLDANDELLLERIQARARWHSIKEKTNQEKYEFLFKYRRSYQQIITKMTSNHGQSLLHFDTGQKSPEQIADEVLQSLNIGFEN